MDLRTALAQLSPASFATALVDPAWRFINSTGKVAPEHRRLHRYSTLTTEQICALEVSRVMNSPAHLYLWVPNALLPDGLAVMAAWGFTYKSNIVWHKVRQDGGSDGRGVGFYFRNVTELVLFGVRGKNARTLAPGRRQVNLLATRKREHSRKPDEQYEIIEACSPGPYLELFARAEQPSETPRANSHRFAWATKSRCGHEHRARSFAVRRQRRDPRSALPSVCPTRRECARAFAEVLCVCRSRHSVP